MAFPLTNPDHGKQSKQVTSVSKNTLDSLRQKAAQLEQQVGAKQIDELLTPEEISDAAPFYFVLRFYIQQLKSAREAAGLTLADVADRSGLAIESLSRLETGAQPNPTWKTLGKYASAVGCRPFLFAGNIAPPVVISTTNSLQPRFSQFANWTHKFIGSKPLFYTRDNTVTLGLCTAAPDNFYQFESSALLPAGG
jgi:transcriptional regulator with XRE-family HTH domain